MIVTWKDGFPEPQMETADVEARIAGILRAHGVEAMITGHISAVFPDGARAAFMPFESDTRRDGLPDRAR